MGVPKGCLGMHRGWLRRRGSRIRVGRSGADRSGSVSGGHSGGQGLGIGGVRRGVGFGQPLRWPGDR